jgi:hypothetical protein
MYYHKLILSNRYPPVSSLEAGIFYPLPANPFNVSYVSCCLRGASDL